MRTFLESLDPGDESRARKALIVLSIAHIAFANVDFASNRLNLGIVEIFFSQAQVSRLGSMGLLIVFIVFSLRSLPIYIKSLEKISVDRLEKEREFARQGFRSTWGLDEEPYPDDDSPEREAAAIEHKHNYKLEITTQRFRKIGFLASAVTVAAVDYGVPTMIFIFAFFDPTFVGLRVGNR